MSSAQFSIKDISSILRRRWKLLFFPLVLVTGICTVGAFMITQVYESSIHILVQQNQIKNPLSNFMMQGNDDPLRGTKQILESSVTIERLIDSLGFRASIKDEIQKRQLAQKISKSMSIATKDDGSVSISYMDSDPQRALHGVLALTNIFVDNEVNSTTEENNSMVDFYQRKLDEFRQKLEDSQEKVLPKISERIKQNATMGISINSVDQQIRDAEKKKSDYEDVLKTIERFRQEDVETKEGREILYELQRNDIPYVLDLRVLLSQYSDMSERYTERNPSVEKVAAQIFDLLNRIKPLTANEIKKLNSSIANLKDQRTNIVNEMVRQSMLERDEKDKEQDLSLYQKLYTEMKVKLEEAQMSQSIAKNNGFRYIILDPAYLPLFPSKPSRMLIVLGGAGAGIFIGFILIVISELLDTRIRTQEQVEHYNKPIIALLPISIIKDKK